MKALVQQSYYSYDSLIESMEVEVLIEEREGIYQGDSFLLVKEGERYGYLRFGWGSCSGCDALEACRDNLEEVTELRDSLYNQIEWRDSAEEMLGWFNNHDWRGDWSFRSEGNRRLVEQAIVLLGGQQVLLCEDCGKKVEQAGKCAECEQEEREHRQREELQAKRTREKAAELEIAEREYRSALAAMSLVTGPGWAPIALKRLPNLEQSLRKLVDLVNYVEGNE